MKKPLRRLLSSSLKKIKQHKELLKKFKFANHEEDFVITAQEEREGGFFGRHNFKTSAA